MGETALGSLGRRWLFGGAATGTDCVVVEPTNLAGARGEQSNSAYRFGESRWASVGDFLPHGIGGRSFV